jgi:hypothetical protein
VSVRDSARSRDAATGSSDEVVVSRLPELICVCSFSAWARSDVRSSVERL